ncbi:translation initiation factor IF-2-like [Acinonyx jubatus]|uniref:Translation initiation factor IF-2-like n=1 Tax=Acinonyx jubatus TaxID=32536 RepID=A0ABM3Q614_ACIJB|nr:translation initiation factor IF-2-like [Acinonyx jubatus]
MSTLALTEGMAAAKQKAYPDTVTQVSQKSASEPSSVQVQEHGTVARDSLKELLLQARPPPPGRRRADAAERGRSYWRGDCTRALFLTTPNSRDPKASPARSRSRAARLPSSPPLPRPDSPKGRPGRPRVPAPRFPVGLIPPGVPLGCSSLVLIKPEWPRASGLSSWRQRRGEEGKKGKAGGSPHRPPRAPRGARAGAPRLSVPTRPATPQRLSELSQVLFCPKKALALPDGASLDLPSASSSRQGGRTRAYRPIPALRAQRAAPRRLSACKLAGLLLPPPNRLRGTQSLRNSCREVPDALNSESLQARQGKVELPRFGPQKPTLGAISFTIVERDQFSSVLAERVKCIRETTGVKVCC